MLTNRIITWNRFICDFLLLIGASLLCSSVTQAEVKAEIDASTGYDSNPLRLSDQLPSPGAKFIEVKASLSDKPKYHGVFYSIGIKSEKFSDDGRHADSTQFGGVLGYQWRPRNAHGRSRYKLRIELDNKDSTYVDRGTGNIAVSGGESVGDRFDSNRASLQGTLSVPISQQTRVVSKLRFRNRAYESYDNIGLSNLDYKQMNLHGGVEHQFNTKLEWEMMGGLGRRLFDDKRTRDLTGSTLIGTDLEYNYLSIESSLNYQLNRLWELSLDYKYASRDDNGPGYYDTTTNHASLGAQYRYKVSRLALGIKYTNREFDNGNPNVTLEEDLREREAVKILAKYQYNLKQRSGMDMDVVAKVALLSSNNSDPLFTYDRNRFYLGLKVNAF